ncbi:CHRD domain-containing protein [Draconibacterium sediminis]|uniref:CHRD domain-containing protein n=1 Tax=Draconibacterium sediminis TaxID=1544798 RepID=UPI0026EAB666|nr:CHRD domain-containing protein [Draconibacterium sediminis]
MKKLSVLMILISIFAFVSCEKSDLIPEDQQELVTKSAKKVLNFRTHLSGDNEVVPVETMATGQAIFQLSKDGTELSYKLIVDSIMDVTMSHIHWAPEGENGSVVAWLYPSGPPPMLIEGYFSGILAEGVIMDSDLKGPLAGGTVMDLVNEIYAGKTYVNVHTLQNPGGELRGQIKGNMPQSDKKND